MLTSNPLSYASRSGWSLALALALAGCTPGSETASRSTTPAPEKTVPAVVSQMIEAHGGLAVWRAAPAVRFTDHVRAPGSKEATATTVTVEQGRRRATIEIPGTGARMGWDGTQAWSLNWPMPTPPRFLAQLNYYFLDLPWLTMDRGVRLAETGTKTLWDDSTEYATVMMTFDPGVGDTPRDSFELYIDPATHRLHACRYVMTYSALMPPGADHVPDHVVVFEDMQTVDGLVVPVRYTNYAADHTPFVTCEVTDWSFTTPFDAAAVAMPEGAVVDTTRP